MEGKSYTQCVRFLHSLADSHCPTVLNIQIFNHQILVNLPQNSTEKLKFLKYV